MLTKRCQEFIEICDTAQPVIELIETGTTDVSHLVAQAKGRTDVHRKDPTGDARTALHGVDYQPQLTDEDIVNLQSRSNKELIMQ